MDANAWIALASVVAFVLCQTAIVAFLLGGLFARVRALEDRPENDCKTELAALGAKVEGLGHAFDEFKNNFREDIGALRTALMAGRGRVRAVE